MATAGAAATSLPARAGNEVTAPVRRGSRVRRRREARTGYALIAPAVAFVGVFILYPLAFGVFVSFTNYPLIGPYHWIGGANYDQLVHNSTFIHSIFFTLEYTAI
ncbi:MAG TPA: hypothetical protein VMD59_13415, partial [Acidimicrobiales bacterium]|nr:hypothetical protein [Acidimicrobiales bacterium]